MFRLFYRWLWTRPVAIALTLYGSALLASAPEWTVDFEPENNLFPALVLASAELPPSASRDPSLLGDPRGLLHVRLQAQRDQEQIVIRWQASPMLPAQTQQYSLPVAGRHYTINPPLRWNRAALRRLVAQQNLNMTLTLQRDQQPASTRQLRLRVHPVRSALYYIDHDGKRSADDVDLNWIFAAFVDETSLAVDALLAEAATALAPASSDQERALALWSALHRRGMRYAMLEGPPAGRGLYSQPVRFPAETWATSAANCVDGSVLLASALQRLGLSPKLVLIPGHMWVAYRDREGRDWHLETTLLGKPSAGEQPDPGQFALPATRNNASARSFVQALALGQQQYQRVEAQFRRADQADYQIIDIEQARRAGVKPIGDEVATLTR